MSTRGRIAAVVTALLLVGGLATCGDPEDDSDGAVSAWPSGGTPLDTSGLVYAVGDTVHLADGSTVAVGADIDTFVLGASGVFYIPSGEHGPAFGGYLQSGPLYFSDGSGEQVRVAEAAATPRTSHDGRYLAYLDLASGEEDDFGTRQVEAVVVDLDSGEEVARSTEAMGSLDDDLDVVYGEALLGFLAIDDTTAYYEGVGDVVAVDLADGTSEVSSRSRTEFLLPPDDNRLSPDGRWRIVDVDRAGGARDRVAPADGPAVALSGVPPTVDLLWWVDDTTAAGYAVDGDVDSGGFAAGTSASLVTCRVPSGACTAVAGTSGVTTHVPAGTIDDPTFVLPDGRRSTT